MQVNVGFGGRRGGVAARGGGAVSGFEGGGVVEELGAGGRGEGKGGAEEVVEVGGGDYGVLVCL